MTDAGHILLEARSWIGTRWHHQGSMKGVGCDCIGFVVGVARECGIAEADSFYNDQEIKGYGRHPNPAMLMNACRRYLDPIPISSLRLADILLMRFHGEPQHFSLLSNQEPNYMIHAYAQARKVVENRIDGVWHSRIICAYRFRGIDG